MPLNAPAILFTMILGTASAIATIVPAHSDPLIINGLYDCARATNGRTYCKKVGAARANQYVPVSEDFFRSYQTAANPPPPPVIAVENQVLNTVVNNVLVLDLKTDVYDMSRQIDVLNVMLSEQQRLSADGKDNNGVIKDTITSIEDRMAQLDAKREAKSRELSKYTTSIRPDDGDSGVTARKASEIHPKVPYYIAGTKESGEFWIEPNVSNTGILTFQMKFVDVDSTAAKKIRSKIDMTPDDLQKTRDALLK
jgi:hypothetical protein